MAKTYSYVREKVPQVTATGISSLPTISWYIYFLCCPTLVYRDSYPRTNAIRWRKVVGYVVQIVVASASTDYLYRSFLEPKLKEFGGQYNWEWVLLSAWIGFPLISCFGFYVLLHLWLNIWAEVTCFGDREFYSDWTAAGSLDFWNKWNIFAHDWIYAYVFNDFLDIVWANRKAAVGVSFLFSALFHEYFLYYSFGFFTGVFPVILVTSGWIVAFKLRLGNFIWMCLNVLSCGALCGMYLFFH